MKTVAGSMKFVALAGLMLAVPGAASAKGIRIVKLDQIGTKTNTAVALNNASFFQTAAQQQWSSLRPKIEQTMKKELGKGNRFAKGVTFYNLKINLAKNITDVRIASGGNGKVIVSFRLNGNYLKATSTTPGPLGKWADPTFEVRFNVIVSIDVALPGKDLRFKAGKATAQISNIRVDSQGVVADAIKLFNNIANFFTKKVSGKKVLISAIEARTFTFSQSLNQSFGNVNNVLKQLAAKKYRLRTARYESKFKQVVVTMHRKTSALTSRAKRAAQTKRLAPGTASSLNPQPLPPRVRRVIPNN
jgi:hypothetical protein